LTALFWPGAKQTYSTLYDPRFPTTELPPPVAAKGGAGCVGSVNYTNPDCFYTSGEIHTVQLRGLTPGTEYTVRARGSAGLARTSPAGPAA
jgi:hypothetical protein